ncbi:MAG: S-layer homology domain-containing protein [Firmicutes bacterium]|nr:S-layer homology domain-containing protein [Bacillota bacterium]
MKKRIALLILAILNISVLQSAVFAEFEWAKTAVEYCVDKKILSGMENGDLALGDNITREQMAKIFVDAFALTSDKSSEIGFSDVSEEKWSYNYIFAFKDYMKKNWTKFKPEEQVTREEFAASLVLASGLKESNIRNSDILSYNFKDASKVDSDYKKLMCIAVERGYYVGDNSYLRPTDLLTRAEACSLLYRVLASKAGTLTLNLGVIPSSTPLLGESQVTLENAKKWAKNKGAAQIYIDIADVYWKYGELTGIRPDILYAQAAKETGFGKFGRMVKAEDNNWAGIKPRYENGDVHEIFATPDDGVRAHFNHVAAYIGTEPYGEPHGRYYSVKSLTWAGTVKTLEELGGKWCPDLYYGYSILHNLLEPMIEVK